MSQEPFKFKPCIPPGTGAGGPVNAFGQQRFVVLRDVAEMPGITRDELKAGPTLPDVRIDEVLDGLVAAGLVQKDGPAYIATAAGKAALEAL